MFKKLIKWHATNKVASTINWGAVNYKKGLNQLKVTIRQTCVNKGKVQLFTNVCLTNAVCGVVE